METSLIRQANTPGGFTLRLETPADYRAVEEMTRDAFWREGVDEHYLVHILRSHPDFIPALDFVAEAEDGQLAGNIMYSKAEIRSADGTVHPVITFGPLTVAPEFQGRGVGQALMTHSIEEAKRLGCRAIVFFGHPDYYPRQGFRRGAEFGITAADGGSFDALMAMPLYEGALDGSAGRIHESDAFLMNPLDVAEFEKNFPKKPFPVLPPISLLFPLLPNEARAPLAAKGMHTLKDLSRISGRELLEITGISREALADINGVLRQYGLPEKRLP